MNQEEQEDNVASVGSNKPTTALGRKTLARKRAKIGSNNSREGASEKKSATYSLSSTINGMQPRQLGVQIRTPPPMGFHSDHVIGGQSTSTNTDKEIAGLKVITKGSQKYVMLSSLKTAKKK